MGSIQGGTVIFAFRENGTLSLFPEGRTYSPPRRGGGISYGNRALCEADAAPEGAYGQCHSPTACCHCPRSRLYGLHILQTGRWHLATSFLRLPASTCHRQLPAVMGALLDAMHPFSLLRKRNRKGQERRHRQEKPGTLSGQGGNVSFPPLTKQ